MNFARDGGDTEGGRSDSRNAGMRGTSTRPGRRIAEAIGCGGEDGESFRILMSKVVAERSRRNGKDVSRG